VIDEIVLLRWFFFFKKILCYYYFLGSWEKSEVHNLASQVKEKKKKVKAPSLASISIGTDLRGLQVYKFSMHWSWLVDWPRNTGGVSVEHFFSLDIVADVNLWRKKERIFFYVKMKKNKNKNKANGSEGSERDLANGVMLDQLKSRDKLRSQ
jgi:hypothetical protein